MTGTISLTQPTTQTLPMSESWTQAVRTSPNDKSQETDIFQSAKAYEIPIASLSNTENLERTKATKKPGERSRQVFSSINNEFRRRNIQDNTYYIKTNGNFTVDQSGKFAYTALHVIRASYDEDNGRLNKDIKITNRNGRSVIIPQGSIVQKAGNDSVVIAIKGKAKPGELDTEIRKLRSIRNELLSDATPILLPTTLYSVGNTRRDPPRQIQGYIVKFRATKSGSDTFDNRLLFIPLNLRDRLSTTTKGDSGSILLTRLPSGGVMESRLSGPTTQGQYFGSNRVSNVELSDDQINQIKKAMIQEGYSVNDVNKLDLRTSPALSLVSPPNFESQSQPQRQRRF